MKQNEEGVEGREKWKERERELLLKEWGGVSMATVSYVLVTSSVSK